MSKSPSGEFWSTLGGDVALVLDDAAGFFTAPLRFGIVEWSQAGLILGVSGLASTQDRNVRNMALRNRPAGIAGSMLAVGREYGSILHLQIAGTALYAAGLFAGEDELRITGRMLTEGILLAGVTRIVLGVAAGRSRPFLDRDPWTFRPPGWKDEVQSFPSGHAAFACVASTILADRISNPIATGVLFTLAAVTGVSRVSDDQHWFSDVVAGSALGIVAGAYVVSRERSRRSNGSGEPPGVRILPGPDRIVLVVAL